MDESAFEELVEPWREVFHHEGSWDKLMARAVAPRLLAVMQGFGVNPENRENFRCIMSRASTISIQHMIVIMDFFFAKWLSFLQDWLNSGQRDFDKVGEWYLEWKSLLPDNEQVRSRLADGLAMMEQAADGKLPVALPRHGQKVVARGADDPVVQMSLKEVVEVFAQRNGLTFRPKPGRMHDGHQMYEFGEMNITVDAHNVVLSAQMDDGYWRPVYLEQLLELAVLKKH